MWIGFPEGRLGASCGITASYTAQCRVPSARRARGHEEIMNDSESIAFIRQFLEVCVRADVEEFASYFTEDAVWWNSPWRPVTGRAAIVDTLRRAVEAKVMTPLPWEVRHIVA